MSDFYDQVYERLEPFLGASTGNFLDKQLAQLGRNADNVDYKDKEELAKWVRISCSLLFDHVQANALYRGILSMENKEIPNSRL